MSKLLDINYALMAQLSYLHWNDLKEDKFENFFLKLNNNFKTIQINKENKEISNIQDVIKEWRKIKKKAILGIDIPAIIDLILYNFQIENTEFLKFSSEMINNLKVYK